MSLGIKTDKLAQLYGVWQKIGQKQTKKRKTYLYKCGNGSDMMLRVPHVVHHNEEKTTQQQQSKVSLVAGNFHSQSSPLLTSFLSMLLFNSLIYPPGWQMVSVSTHTSPKSVRGNDDQAAAPFYFRREGEVFFFGRRCLFQRVPKPSSGYDALNGKYDPDGESFVLHFDGGRTADRYGRDRP